MPGRTIDVPPERQLTLEELDDALRTHFGSKYQVYRWSTINAPPFGMWGRHYVVVRKSPLKAISIEGHVRQPWPTIDVVGRSVTNEFLLSVLFWIPIVGWHALWKGPIEAWDEMGQEVVDFLMEQYDPHP